MDNVDVLKIIGLFPLTGNGGIASWTKKFMKTFPNNEYIFTFIDVAPVKERKTENDNIFIRTITGLYSMIRLLKKIKGIMSLEKYDILHTTTSGNVGSLRDLYVAKLCHKKGVKAIMHCRYGCITEDIASKGLVGILLRKAMAEFDQIWVLDKRSYNTLKNIDTYKNKVFLTPNSIDVQKPIDNTPKNYQSIAFCGNIIPSKGIIELIDAVAKTVDVTLHVIGSGPDAVKKQMENAAGVLAGKRIFFHGRLPNEEAVKIMENIDMVALPTYYPSEAFPISIIEAMSLTKMVISCRRAAIPDMLTNPDGTMCGILVEPQSSDSIVEAIKWCQNNKDKADIMCRQAYEKVYSTYRKDVVYDLYRKNYQLLMQN